MVPLAELKDALRLDTADVSEDAYLTRLEAAAVAFFERSTGRYFGPVAARVDYIDTVGVGRDLWLKDEPAGVVTVTAAGVAVPAESFEVRGRVLRSPSGWGPAEYTITYSAGYAAGKEPPDIRQAVTEIVGRMYEFRTTIVTGTIVAEVPFGVRATLAHWKRWTI